MLARYRRAGADPPWRDPAGYHGVSMEGYYWRLADRATGVAVVALCGTLADRRGRARGLVAVGADAGPARWRWADPVTADPRGLGLRAGDALRAEPDHLLVDLGAGARLEAALRPRPWTRSLGGLGAAHLLPRLGQYWHPHAPAGTADADIDLPGAPARLAGAALYAEKNWGRAFPRRWWWGQAGTWTAGDDATLAFAGGLLLRRGPAVAATAAVLRLEDRIERFVAPTALVRARVGGGRWQVTARGRAGSLVVEAEAGSRPPLALPVPPAPPGGAVGEVAQHQHGRLRATLRRGRRTVWHGESDLAGLEAGGL